tara:strand:+ start:101 stop:511 length:411 start_codon:yes stop_codon:yes gene_type:complete
MADPVELLIQGAIVTRLKADADVGTLIGDKIYDRVPSGAVFPYATIRIPQVLDEENSCSLSDTVVIELHAWSRAPGFVECRRIIGAMKAAIRSSAITVTGHDISLQYVEQTRYLDDPDGLTAHGVVVFQFETNPTS